MKTKIQSVLRRFFKKTATHNDWKYLQLHLAKINELKPNKKTKL